ncbi:monovalent cation/H+ antiporter subunit D [Tranquillimonas alkanivorans]|uniref:Multisubunit potassium/proton antiporter, PhaD subunit n=1 Tax=Tranquillimonas alkanivorans TaxID=441119 RepID=A0A1I5Q876_9RHOB|nr:monovalent cation/H+ antiporter subunit D [Tranquillimonas alkanivorans]SFP42372.1 multisubunit potassium/proton antiporter, PhaD subunit [Tranquillimonas alkanivorans]
MTHWTIAPIVLPAMLAALITLAARNHPALQRVLSVAGTVTLFVIAVGLALRASTGEIAVYELGDWPAPFGIVLVADRLSTMMVLLTATLANAVVLYAIGTGWDTRGRHFHALFQFQLMGIVGAFLTGDAFNLFVFFEVLLIASYGLMIHSGGTARLRAGMQYVVYNLLGSTLFLFALGTIYAVTGTLNMADLAERVATLPEADTALIRVGATLLALVFAVKAAVLPLHFWLPGSYANAPGPVAALFAIMTKVGAYAMLRFFTLVFPPELGATEGMFGAILLPAALLTLAIGMIGILGAKRLDRLAAYAVIGSMGTLLIAVAILTPQATTAALYYIIHSTFASAVLFLVVDLVVQGRGAAGARIEAAAPIARNGLVAAMFFTAAIALAGVPPLSGFVGKLLVMDAARSSDPVWTIWATILVTSLIALVGFARAGSTVFWKTAQLDTAEADPAGPAGSTVLPLVSIGGLLTLLVGITVLAGPLTEYVGETTRQLYSPSQYIDAVLTTDEVAK